MTLHTQTNSPDVVVRAEDFRPELLERAQEIEDTRYLPQDIADRFAEAGFYRLCVPAVYDGLEVSARTLVEVIETVAQADGSAAWCVFIGSTTGATAAYLPEATARAVYADNPLGITGGVFAPKGKAKRETLDGRKGFRVNGRWQWGSGSKNCSWLMGGSLVIADGEVERLDNGQGNNRMMIVPADEAEILDTWYTSGLCGTGSNDFEIRDAFVEEGWSVGLMSDTPLERPLYAFPVFGLLGLGIAGVTLGLARAAIDEVAELAGGKTPQGSAKPLAMRPGAQNDIAEAEATMRAARAFLYETIDSAWDTAERTGEISVDERRDLRLATTHAAHSSARAVDLMYNLAGGTSVYRRSPLQRIFRDVHVATQHMMVGPATMELAGRLFFGLETDTSML